MTFETRIRILTITALFSDDLLFEQIVLKGGNAMSLVHQISPRVSQDLDFSLADDFDNLQDTLRRMETQLLRSFRAESLIPFDVKLTPKPAEPNQSTPSWWGGYVLEFKVSPEDQHKTLAHHPERLRRSASVIGPKQRKVFKVDFSKNEFTEPKTKVDLDHQTIYVYPPALIAVEKLRAICQQMEGYELMAGTRRPRARDFFDIYSIVTGTAFRFDSAEARSLIPPVFAAKHVPLALIGKIPETSAFHANDWPSVTASVVHDLEDFAYYFDFVLRELAPLKALWA